jgi:hypothetical protein
VQVRNPCEEVEWESELRETRVKVLEVVKEELGLVRSVEEVCNALIEFLQFLIHSLEILHSEDHILLLILELSNLHTITTTILTVDS